MQVSVAFPTALDSHENIALAEELGYERAWLYDTPQNSPDVWMTLALAAERTTRIGLGPGVLVPSPRHPMVNAAATAALVAMAPDRVQVRARAKSALRGLTCSYGGQRPEAGLLHHGYALYLQVSTRLLARSERCGGPSVDPTAPIRHRIAASLRQHTGRSAPCLTTLHEPWLEGAGPHPAVPAADRRHHQGRSRPDQRRTTNPLKKPQ